MTRRAISKANAQPMVPWAVGSALVAFLATTTGQSLLERVAPDHGPKLAEIHVELVQLDKDVSSLARACWRLGARDGAWTNRTTEDR